MSKQRDEELTADLLDVLGEDGFLALVEAHGGLRLYVPANLERSDLPETIGADTAHRLSKKYPGSYISIPLAREFRAVRYFGAGMTDREIARRLGLTESGVNRMIKRARSKKKITRRSRKDPRQLDMF